MSKHINKPDGGLDCTPKFVPSFLTWLLASVLFTTQRSARHPSLMDSKQKPRGANTKLHGKQSLAGGRARLGKPVEQTGPPGRAGPRQATQRFGALNKKRTVQQRSARLTSNSHAAIRWKPATPSINRFGEGLMERTDAHPPIAYSLVACSWS